jgi:hypothetical protein
VQHTLAINPIATLHPLVPERRLRAIPSAAAPARPADVALVVTRLPAGAERGTCALCWTGPGPLAGSVRQRATRADDAALTICSRCLVTLEMLAVQFAPHVRLCVETPT